MQEVGPCDLSAFVLAGGKSSRMGSDKAFVAFRDQPLLARALDLARSIASDVRIVGSREKFADYAPVVEDTFRDCGPLGGIHAALSSSSTELNLILAVDMPLISSEFLRYLSGVARISTAAQVVIPRIETGWQPLCAIYRRGILDAAENALRAGQFKIGLVFEKAAIRVVDEDELAAGGFSSDMFRNINTPDQLRQAGMSFTKNTSTLEIHHG